MLLSSVQIANYEYGFYWYFYNDGHIEHEVKLTGCLSTNLLSPGEGPDPTHGTLMAPGLNAQVTCLTSYLCVILLINYASGGIDEHLIIMPLDCECCMRNGSAGFVQPLHYV